MAQQHLGSTISHGLGRRRALRLLTGGVALAGLSFTALTPASAATFAQVAAAPSQPGPMLFGTRQRLLPDTARFRERSSILRSWKELDSSAADQPTQGWARRLATLRALAPERQLEAVNEMVNAQPYIPDDLRHQKSDLWSMPADFLSGGGDCEEFAITKYTALRWLGFHVDRLRLVLGRLPRERLYHALLTVDTGDDVLVLDNLMQRVLRQDDAARYFVPILSMNESRYWLHHR
ncbi:MAG: transglutaminase-like cysteine peptidase [Alphaproteobacteria bacterium]|nr:transglutaminase-like cysteine peptidase [Alphaproteobacteria bacterium]